MLTDATGAVVQGAKVILLDEQKGYQFTTTSNNEGRYLFASIPPGSYTVTAEMKGFEKTVRTHIRLNVSENPSANLTMKIAGGKETVEVEAQTTTIATEDAVTGQVIDRRFINDMPLINRSVMNLTYLAPGVTDADDQCSEVQGCTGTNFVINGSRSSGADVLLDGASATNFEPNGGITNVTYLPSPEAVEEFKLQQSNFSAEYGFSGASVVNMVTRSGSNSFHGSAYDFIRNTIGDANDWFSDRANPVVPIPQVHRHNFGGTIGGPIFKNKTFFFFDYDGVRANNPETHTAGVPSAPERTRVISAKSAGRTAVRRIPRGRAAPRPGSFGILIPSVRTPIAPRTAVPCATHSSRTTILPTTSAWAALLTYPLALVSNQPRA